MQASSSSHFSSPLLSLCNLCFPSSAPLPFTRSQYNNGNGGCFPWHYDNPAPPDKRRLSCLLYLNPDWRGGDGGEIVVAPFLRAKHVVPPLLDRLVFFFSETTLHRVLPSQTQRSCLTIWLDSDVANDDTQAPPWPGLDMSDPTMRSLARPSVQVCVCVCVCVLVIYEKEI